MILRICVVIPTFDNPRTISRVTRDVVLSVPYPVLIIDDGSETPVTSNLYSFEVKEAIERGRVRVVRFEKRLGKGAALRYALRDLAASGYTHMMTLDADGRHLGRELKTLTDQTRAHPWDLIVGQRQIPKSAPRNFWARLVQRVLEYSVRFETGTRIEDPQSGFRSYPLLPLQMLDFRTRNHEFDLEILIRALWNGVVVREVPVAVREPEPEDRVESRHRWIDTLRLSTLNLILITVTLLRTRSHPRELAAAIGVGVFVGCTPLLGFHAGAAVLLAAMLRLNVVAVLIGSRISTAPLLPALIFASVYIGQHWLKIPLSTGYMSHVYRWAAGSVVLGVLLGLVAALLTYLVARAAQNPRPVDQAARGGTSWLRWVNQRGGRAVGRAWAAVAAAYYVLTSLQIRGGLGEYYRTLSPRLGVFARGQKRFEHLRTFIEMQADQFEPDLAGRLEGEGELGHAVVTAHLGSWDNAARAANLAQVANVYYPDRPTAHGRLEIIPFLGHLATFDVSAFQIAAAEVGKLSTAFAVREDDGYVIHARGARKYALRDDAAPEMQIYEWASRFVLQLEFMVRKHPEQWTKLYRFWSSIPVEARHNGDVGVPIEELHAAVPRLRPHRTDD